MATTQRKFKPVMVTLSDREMGILQQFKAENDLSAERGNSIALRMILRDWQRRHARKAPSTQRDIEPA